MVSSNPLKHRQCQRDFPMNLRFGPSVTRERHAFARDFHASQLFRDPTRSPPFGGLGAIMQKA